jgi:hypothetical protein
MPRKPVRVGLPGNDGRWFLELVGVAEPAVDPSDAYATLESLVPPGVPDDTSTMSMGSLAASVNGALTAAATENGEFVPLGSTTAPLIYETEQRSRRWMAMVAVAIILAAAVGTAVYALPKAAEDEAAMLAAQYRAALTDLRVELPNTQRAIGALTDPAAPETDVAASPTAMAELASASAATTALGTKPLPATLPLVSRAPFEALEPTRTAMTILGPTGGDIATRLGVAFTYRTTIDSLFAVEGLPTTASDAEIAQLSLVLATDLAETSRLVADLPPDASFSDLAEAATSASDRYATWQLEYLAALRDGDAERAGALVAELGTTVASLGRVDDDALAALRIELDTALVELGAELDAAIASVGS